MSAEVPSALRIVCRLSASPERVFDAWTDPALARGWLFTSSASDDSRHRLDARIGGKWTITDRRDGTDYTASGEYLAVERPRRLVFSFAMPQFSPNSDRITVTIDPEDDGSLMTFVQEGEDIGQELRSSPAGAESGSEAGWRQMFDNLAAVLARSAGYGEVLEPGMVRFERLLPGPIERVWEWLADSDKRARWLAAGEMPSYAGGRFSLRFDHAALSPREAPAPACFRHYEGGVVNEHGITRWEPPHVLAFTWGGGAEGPSEVTFELSQRGDRVRLVLTHRRLAVGETMINVAGGWHTHLAILQDKLNDRIPPAFWTLFEGIENEYRRRLREAGVSPAPGETIAVRVVRRFEAAPEQVFDAWLDPVLARRWLYATPEGEMQRVEIDARVGGSFLIVEQRRGELAEHFGEYLELERPRRLVFSFGVDRTSSERDRVTVEIFPLEDGCELRLVHEMAPAWAAYREQTERGWAAMLDSLCKALDIALGR